MIVVRAACFTLALLTCCRWTTAWSGEGHQLIGLIASSRFTPQTWDAIEELLGEGVYPSDAEIANWADEIRRQRRDTAPFHRATQVVWLDLPRSVVMTQVFWRSLCRAALRQELWNGNRETFLSWLRADHPIRWAWATYHDRQNRFAQKMTSNWIRLHSRRQIRQWLDVLGKEVAS